MFKSLRRLKRDEEGAVTVDWVVLTAAVVGMIVAIVHQMDANTLSLANATADRIAAEPNPADF